MRFFIHPDRPLFSRDPMIYGQFIEHFHRQIYGGIYDPSSPFADEDGFRQDVLEALRAIATPIVRWPGGCFVSSYHWQYAVGKNRVPMFDKAWRVEDDNAFGTDEFVRFAKKLGAEPYICTNAGTGTSEEMSDWAEYCNLKDMGHFAKMRIENGHPEPHNVKYWSIGNENYGSWEIGAKSAEEWGRYVLESAKMLKHVDPTISLSAAALDDLDWNINLLKHCADQLEWISLHQYWDALHQEDNAASYMESMAYTHDLTRSIDRARGLLAAMNIKHIKIAFDEWNLRGWHHPNIHSKKLGVTEEEYLAPRDRNDINATYTMADAVFTGCFLNALLRNADLVRMANYAPAVNTRGLIFTHEKGIVKRSTYYVFELFTRYMGDQIIGSWSSDAERMTAPKKSGGTIDVDQVDAVATRDSATGNLAISLINKSPDKAVTVNVDIDAAHAGAVKTYTVAGDGPDAYNDIDREPIRIEAGIMAAERTERGFHFTVGPHSVNVARVE